LRMHRIVLRDVNWIGDRALDRALGEGLEIFVKVRSTRAPQAAWLRARGWSYEVELADGEEGVSPGQACVFYDALSGQAPCWAAIHQERRGKGHEPAPEARSRRGAGRCCRHAR